MDSDEPGPDKSPPNTASPPDEQLYRSLDAGRLQIRRLALEPGTLNDPIIATIDIVFLDASPSYTALSYVWGHDVARSPMSVGASSVSITKNLDIALRHLRPPREVETPKQTTLPQSLPVISTMGHLKQQAPNRYFWIDAICINQADLKEKAEQVKQMGLIYSKAEKVIAWLGNADTTYEAAATFFGALDDQREYLRPFASNSRSASLQGTQMHHDPKFAYILRSQRRPTHALRGLSQLLTRSYWERVWIIQEISKAADVEVRFGQFSVHLDLLLLASKNIKDLPKRIESLLGAVIKFRAQEQGYGGLSPGSRMTLLDAIVTSRYSLATDQRDKIYAILGMTCDGADLVPLLTYVNTVEKVFEDLSSAMIRSRSPSNVLLIGKWAPAKETFRDAPSWCVDWANLCYHLPPWLTGTGKSKLASMATTCQPSFEENKLVTRGWYVGQLPEPESSRPYASTLHNIAQSRSSSHMMHRSAMPAAPPSPLPSIPQPPSSAHIIHPPPAPASPRRPIKLNAILAENILTQLTSDLLDSFAPGYKLPENITRDDIRDALARMIRDAQKGEASADYDVNCVADIFVDLGSSIYAGNLIWDWARQYNAYKAEAVFRTPEHLQQTSVHDSENDSSSTSSRPNARPTSKRSTVSTQSTPGQRRGAKDRSSQSHVSPSMVIAVRAKSVATPPPSPRPPAPSPEAFRFWENVVSVSDATPEYKMRFAFAKFPSHPEEERLILASDDARPGDLIYRIEHSNLPILLRKVLGGFEFIGDICLGRTADGAWRTHHLCERKDSKDPFASNSSNDVEIIHISLEDEFRHRRPHYSLLYDG